MGANCVGHLETKAEELIKEMGANCVGYLETALLSGPPRDSATDSSCSLTSMQQTNVS